MEVIARASQRFSWGKKERSTSTVSSDVSLFQSESTACRAQVVQDSQMVSLAYKRDKRKSRKKKIFEALALHEKDLEKSSTSAESKKQKRPSVGPIKVT